MGIFDTLFGGGTQQNIVTLPDNPLEIYEEARNEIGDILAPGAIQITSNNISLGNKICKVFFVISYPRYLQDGWLSEMVNLDTAFDLSMHIEPIETSEALKSFKKKVAEVESQIMERQEKGLVRDPKLDVAYQDLDRLRDELQQSTEKIFTVGLYFTLYADDITELTKKENEIKSMLESKMIYIKPALFDQEKGFKTTLPLGHDELNITNKLNSGPLRAFFPFISSDLSQNRGILYGLNRHNNGLVIFDRYSQPNYNSVLFATSGAGKSYATKLEILRTMMFETEVIIIDPEREYEFLANSVGGRNFNISLSGEHHLNPFDLPEVQADENPSDILRSNIIHLVGLFRILLGGLTPEEDAVVDRAIAETYMLKDISENVNFNGKEPPLLSDFEMVLSSMEGTESLVARIHKYTLGSWSGFLNKPTNIDIDKKLIVFSIRDMEDELKPAAMYIITHYIWNAIRKNLKKRLLVVDEAWWMMKSDDTASFLFSIAKRGRKYFLGLATITQDVDDFMKSKFGLPIVTNSSIQILLKQSPSSIDNLQKVFNLTDQEKFMLLESNVGEGIFFAGLEHAAIKIVSSYTEDQIVTSNPAQILAMRKDKLKELEG